MILLLLALLAAPEARTFHPVFLADLAAGRVRRTHVEVSGFATYQKMEADGDRHIRLCEAPDVETMDRSRCVVLECIPFHPCPPAPTGIRITARGISRFDPENGHRWAEVHPLEWWSWGGPSK